MNSTTDRITRICPAYYIVKTNNTKLYVRFLSRTRADCFTDSRIIASLLNKPANPTPNDDDGMRLNGVDYDVRLLLQSKPDSDLDNWNREVPEGVFVQRHWQTLMMHRRGSMGEATSSAQHKARELCHEAVAALLAAYPAAIEEGEHCHLKEKQRAAVEQYENARKRLDELREELTVATKQLLAHEAKMKP